jgi:hypothetical protein
VKDILAYSTGEAVQTKDHIDPVNPRRSIPLCRLLIGQGTGVQMSQAINFSIELKWLPLHGFSVSRLTQPSWILQCEAND